MDGSRLSQRKSIVRPALRRDIVPSMLGAEDHMAIHIRRRELIVAFGGAAVWPIAAHAQHAANMPTIPDCLVVPNGSGYGGCTPDGLITVRSAFDPARFTVLALDGNPVPTPASVEVLKLDVAERADVIVEMSADAPAPLRGANKVLGGSPAWRDTHELRPRVRSL
jgi:hypothetical protein